MHSTAWRLLSRLVALVGVASLPVVFSAWLDPARLLNRRGGEREIAEALTAGHYVTNVMNYDDRLINRHLATLQRTAPQVLALGSSRIQQVSPAAIPGCRFFNAGVSDGRFDDFLGLYQLYAEPAHRPAHLLLGLDPWSFVPITSRPPWESIAESRAKMLTALGLPHSPIADKLRLRIADLQILASPEYFRIALFSLRHHGSEGIRFTVTDSAQNIEKTKAPDGSIIWFPQSTAKSDSIATDFIRQMHLRTAPYNGTERADSAGLATLERFTRYLRAQGVTVTFVLIPFHPRVYREFLLQPGQAIVDAERRYRDLADRAGAAVVGSYDPAVTHSAGEDFFDQSHMRPAPLGRMVSTSISCSSS